MTFSPNKVPVARRNDLVIQELEKEILIYDLQKDKAFCLNHTVAFIWQNCDGFHSPSQIAYLLSKELKTPVDESIVWYALKQLKEQNLLADNLPIPPQILGMNRRQVINALGLAATVALPIVIGITAPTPANAASAGTILNGRICTTNSQCASGYCGSGHCCNQPSIFVDRCTTSYDCCGADTVCTNGICTAGVNGNTNGTNGSTNGNSGGGTGGYCILFETPILQADEQSVKAVDVFVGQELLGINCINGETIAGRVKAVQRSFSDSFYSLTAESGDTVHCTPSHPIIKGFGDTWGTPVEKFSIGDAMLVYDEQSKRIVEAKTVAVELVKVPQPVIVIEMDTIEHTFISGSIVSHNKFCTTCDP